MKTAIPQSPADTDERGNEVSRWGVWFTMARGIEDRYAWDFGPCGSHTGWTQYDTDQDASYFGVWVHVEDRVILTYAEGDVTVTRCATMESYRAELANMEKFYGDPPPAFVVIDTEANSVTNVYDVRPS